MRLPWTTPLMLACGRKAPRSPGGVPLEARLNGATSDSGMSADLDIYRTANLLIKEHGEDA